MSKMLNVPNTLKNLGKIVVLALPVLLILAPTPLPADESDSKLSFRRGTADYFENGQIKKCRLEGDEEVQGLPCSGWIWFFEDGSLKSLQLAEGREIQGNWIPSRTRVWLTPKGELDHCWLSENTTIQGLPCKGSTWSKVDTSFYNTGKLKTAFLSQPIGIDGIPCKHGIFKFLELHENGNLKKATLAEPVELNGNKYEKGATLNLDVEGNVLSVE